MGSMEDEVRELIADTFGSVPKLADALGMHPQTIYSALRNGLVGASVATVMPIAEALHIDPFQLLQNKVVKIPSAEQGYVNVPLYGSIAAGNPLEPIALSESFPIPAQLADQYPHAFLLIVSGESMNRVLPNGCYALINPCTEITRSGDPYAVSVGLQNATIKRVTLLNNGLVLEPDSTDPTFKARIFDFADSNTEPVGIIGRVVWFCSPLNWQD